MSNVIIIILLIEVVLYLHSINKKIMSNRCTKTEPGCGCVDGPMTTPPACPPLPCDNPQPCSSYTDAQCVIYTGEDIICNEQVIAEQNQPLSEILQNLTDLACSSPIIVDAILCGEDTVVAAGSTTQQALTAIVNYFCIVTLRKETIMNVSPADIGNSVTVNYALGTQDFVMSVYTENTNTKISDNSIEIINITATTFDIRSLVSFIVGTTLKVVLIA
jgi:hypothetical protein